MFYQIIRQSRVKGHRGYAGKVMLVRNIITAKIKGEVLGNLNIGNLHRAKINLSTAALSFCL